MGREQGQRCKPWWTGPTQGIDRDPKERPARTREARHASDVDDQPLVPNVKRVRTQGYPASVLRRKMDLKCSFRQECRRLSVRRRFDQSAVPRLARPTDRAWVVGNLNAWHGNGQQCFGRVLGFLEIGVRLGYWSRTTADGVAESVRQGYGLRSIWQRLLQRAISRWVVGIGVLDCQEGRSVRSMRARSPSRRVSHGRDDAHGHADGAADVLT